MNFDIIEKHILFEVDGVQIPAAITAPKQRNVMWGVVIIPGSFFNDVDGNYSIKDNNPFDIKAHTYADLARQLAQKGHAVFRYARAGTIVVDNKKAIVHKRFDERIVVAVHACRMLRKFVPRVKNLALAGHSEGSVVALLLLHRHKRMKIDAYISLSGPAYRLFDLIVRQAEKRMQDGILTLGETKVPFEHYRKSIELIRAGEPIPDDLKKELPPFGIHVMDEIAKQYLRDYDRIDPSLAIAEVSRPVLIVQGGKDTSVHLENAERLYEAHRQNQKNTTMAYFSDLQHFYKKVQVGRMSDESFTMDYDSDERVSNAISEWMYRLKY